MPPRILRPRSDAPWWSVTLGLGFVSLALGYGVGARVFRPGSLAPEGTNSDATGNGTADVTSDAGSSAGDAGPLGDARAFVAPRASPVTAHVGPGVLSGCGDGEEISLRADQCDTPTGLETALREHLADLGTCPPALTAARDPSRVLSLGLRVNYDRRQVAVVLGRSTTVSDRVSYLPCALELLHDAGGLWQTHGAHPHYFYYYAVHFAPSGATVPLAPIAPTVPVRDGGMPVAPTPTVAVAPAVSELVAMHPSGQATVTWARAVVRDAPRDGAIVSRLPQGATVDLLERQGSWWAIRWEGTHVGWVFRDAIGQPP